MNSDLFVQQEALQKEAQEVLEKLDLLNLLSKYGKPEIIGSMALGLMVWRDIDITIVTKNPNQKNLVELSSLLITKTSQKIDLSFMNNLFYHGLSGCPKGFYFGIKYYDNLPSEEKWLRGDKRIWKIDLWFVKKEDDLGIAKTAELKKSLTVKKEKIILEIKNALWDHPLYRKEIKSMDIYEAVLEKGIKNLAEFKKYLEGKNIILAGA